MSFVKKSKLFMLISAGILVVGIAVAVICGGLNLGIDFSSGSIITFDMGEAFDTQDVSNALQECGFQTAPVLLTSSSESAHLAQVRTRALADEDQEIAMRDKALKILKEKYENSSLESVERVGASASAELIKNAALSILIACALILLYIWIRFEFVSGVAAVMCLLHDVLIMVAVVSIVRMEINSTFIAAILTIVGYSINNTIVVFDRIRGNKELYPKKDMANVVDQSIKETLRRSLFTSLTTFVMIFMLYILGVESIKEFALPIIIGLLAGTYSSIFIAGPLWTSLAVLAKNKKK